MMYAVVAFSGGGEKGVVMRMIPWRIMVNLLPQDVVSSPCHLHTRGKTEEWSGLAVAGVCLTVL